MPAGNFTNLTTAYAMHFIPKLRAATTSQLRSFWLSTGLAIWLVVFMPRLARAEDSVAYKYADYQEMDGRMRIKTQSALSNRISAPRCT